MVRSNPAAELRGSMTALVTPFREGQVDWVCLDRLVDRQIDGGIDVLVPCGTTGETPTLTSAEWVEYVDRVITQVAGRCQVMVGTGSNSTVVTVDQTRRAAAAGATAALIVAPYYNRPTAEGLYRHFAEVAESVDLPIVLYNVPARTGVDIPNDVVVRLRESFPHVVAIKHATGTVDGVTELLGRCDIDVLSGDDTLVWPLMALGAVGAISVVSNLSPSLMKSLVVAALHGDCSAALRHHRRVYALAAGISDYGPNPVPIKTAMALNGLLHEEFRLPLCPVTSEARAAIAGLLNRLELSETSAS